MIMLLRIALLAAALLLISPITLAQSESGLPAAGPLEVIRLQNGLPGMSVRGYSWDADTGSPATVTRIDAGVRAAGSEVAVEPGDLWHIGSCTKAITATLLATYVAEGRLSWTDTLAEALPDFAGDMSETAANATIADLLRHRAGLPPNPTGVLMLRLFEEEARVGREAAILEGLSEATNAPGPGDQGRYSNLGYMVAGVIAERLGGKAYEDLVVERVLMPLGIQEGEFGFGPPPAGDDASAPEQPMGHRRRGNQPWTPQLPTPEAKGLAADNPAAFGPAGTMYLTLDAWSRFCMAHARSDDLQEGQRDALGLSGVDYAELHRPEEVFAAGWVIAQRGWAGDGEGGGIALTHNGSNTMWFATAWIAPERDWVMLATTNAAGPTAAQACDQAVGVALGALRDTVDEESGGQSRPEQGEDQSSQ